MSNILWYMLWMFFYMLWNNERLQMLFMTIAVLKHPWFFITTTLGENWTSLDHFSTTRYESLKMRYYLDHFSSLTLCRHIHFALKFFIGFIVHKCYLFFNSLYQMHLLVIWSYLINDVGCSDNNTYHNKCNACLIFSCFKVII